MNYRKKQNEVKQKGNVLNPWPIHLVLLHNNNAIHHYILSFYISYHKTTNSYDVISLYLQHMYVCLNEQLKYFNYGTLVNCSKAICLKSLSVKLL